MNAAEPQKICRNDFIKPDFKVQSTAIQYSILKGIKVAKQSCAGNFTELDALNDLIFVWIMVSKPKSENKMSKSNEKLIRYTLSVLLVFLAINAFGGGYYGISGAKDIPLQWLQGSPFHDYFIPGLVLILIVGGSAFIAAIAVLSRHRFTRQAALSCGLVVLVWLSVQISTIGYVSWMQPATGFVALIILFLTLQLPKYNYFVK